MNDYPHEEVAELARQAASEQIKRYNSASKHYLTIDVDEDADVDETPEPKGAWVQCWIFVSEEQIKAQLDKN